MSAGSNSGAYGFRIVPQDPDQSLPGLTEQDPDAPTVELRWELGPTMEDVLDVGADRARIAVRDVVTIDVDRERLSVHVRLPEPPRPEGLVHPVLTTPLAIMNRWEGRPSLHAGAVHDGSGALALCGLNAAGKSSALAALARRGLPIISDDLVVVDGGDVLAGPSCVDLRPDVARRFPDAESLGVIGARERFRLTTPAAPARSPLLAVVLLEWGDVDAPRLAPLTVVERAGLVHAFDYAALVGLPEPRALLDLVELPMWRLTRSRDDSADTALDLLLERDLSGSPATRAAATAATGRPVTASPTRP